MEEQPVIDPERQRKARDYNRLERIWSLASTGLAFVALLVFLASGLSNGLRARVLSITSDPWLVVLLYVVIVAVGTGILFSPIQVYTGYLLPRSYGLVIQNFRGWLLDRAKGGLLGGAIALLAVEVVYYLLRTFPVFWWLIAAALAAAFSVLMANLGPILIAPLLEKYTPLDNEELRSRLQRLVERAGAKVSGVYTVHLGQKTTRANAMVTGIGRARRIVLVDTLFGKYSDEEIEVILAHELGHQVHSDVWKGIGLETAVILLTFFVGSLTLSAGMSVFGYHGIADIAGFPVLAITLMVVGFATMPLVNWLSRLMERAADRFALQMTKNPPAFIAMMSKLTSQNLGELEPPRWVKILFYSHPTSAERIGYATRLAAQPGNGR